MCLIAFAFQSHPNYPLIIIANRDEFYDRPTAPAHYWEDAPTILAGRDLKKHGGWMGVSKNGRFAAVTNYRDPSRHDYGKLSRGHIVHDFLTSPTDAHAFLESLRPRKDHYSGLNILLYDGITLHHYNNVYDEHTMITAGVHSVSNATLNTNWPKSVYATSTLQAAVANETFEVAELISLLQNDHVAKDALLPNTGVGLYLERALSAAFIHSPVYGTRCSTAITFHESGTINFLERTYSYGKVAFDRHFEMNPLRKEPSY